MAINLHTTTMLLVEVRNVGCRLRAGLPIAQSLIPSDFHELLVTLGQSIFLPPFFPANGEIRSGRLFSLIVFLLVLSSQNSQLFTQSTLEGLNPATLLQIKRTVSFADVSLKVAELNPWVITVSRA